MKFIFSIVLTFFVIVLTVYIVDIKMKNLFAWHTHSVLCLRLGIKLCYAAISLCCWWGAGGALLNGRSISSPIFSFHFQCVFPTVTKCFVIEVCVIIGVSF